MAKFRRPARVPGARREGVAGLADLADLTDPAAVDAVLMELDDLRTTVYRQSCQLRDVDSRMSKAVADARADEHRRVLVAVSAMSALAVADPAATPDVRSFAARIEAAVVRLTPPPPA